MVLVDSHVHVHPCFDLARVLDTAAENFRRHALGAGCDGHYQAVLCLTETASADCFFRMCEAGQRSRTVGAQESGWRIERTEDDAALIARNPRRPALIVIAGSQIVTEERLEVLAIGTVRRFPDGRPIARVIDDVLDNGAIPVVPWGFGKWIGARGEIVSRLIAEAASRGVYLGDNGNRLRGGRTPRQFEAAAQRGIRILPGSDPLPFRTETRRVGAYGFILSGSLDVQRPATDLTRRMREGFAPLPYGTREGIVRFVRNQVAMQLVKRLAT